MQKHILNGLNRLNRSIHLALRFLLPVQAFLVGSQIHAQTWSEYIPTDKVESVRTARESAMKIALGGKSPKQILCSKIFGFQMPPLTEQRRLSTQEQTALNLWTIVKLQPLPQVSAGLALRAPNRQNLDLRLPKDVHEKNFFHPGGEPVSIGEFLQFELRDWFVAIENLSAFQSRASIKALKIADQEFLARLSRIDVENPKRNSFVASKLTIKEKLMLVTALMKQELDNAPLAPESDLYIPLTQEEKDNYFRLLLAVNMSLQSLFDGISESLSPRFQSGPFQVRFVNFPQTALAWMGIDAGQKLQLNWAPPQASLETPTPEAHDDQTMAAIDSRYSWVWDSAALQPLLLDFVEKIQKLEKAKSR